MKTLFSILTLCLLPALTQAELLENGDFAKGTRYWRVNRHEGYGAMTTAKVEKGELHLGSLTSLSAHYLHVVQPVMIEEGTRYRLSAELKGAPESIIAFSIGDHGAREVSAAKRKLTKTGWEELEFEFTAKCSTDSKWFKKTKKFYGGNELGTKGVTLVNAKDAKKYREKLGSVGYTCTAAIALGAVEGSIAIRNVSLVEITGTK